MNSWKLFRHSLSMVIKNFDVALKLSIPIFAVMILSLILFGPAVITGDMGYDPYGEIPFDATEAFNSVITVILQVIASLWVAVAWHRFILLEERPSGWLPTFHGSRILAYFGWGLLLAIIVGVVAGIIGGIGGFVMAMGGGATGLIGGIVIFIAAALAIVISIRLYVILPAVAIGEKLSIGQAWEATRGHAGTIFLAYLIYVILAIGLGIVIGLLSVFTGFVGALLMIIMQVILTMIGLSFLTTIYGVTVEGRELS